MRFAGRRAKREEAFGDDGHFRYFLLYPTTALLCDERVVTEGTQNQIGHYYGKAEGRTIYLTQNESNIENCVGHEILFSTR